MGWVVGMVVVGWWVMVGYGVGGGDIDGETGLTQTCRDVEIPSRAMMIRLSCFWGQLGWGAP